MKRFIFVILAAVSTLASAASFPSDSAAYAALQADFKAFVNSPATLPNPGNSMAWAGGTIVRNAAGQLIFNCGSTPWIMSYFIGQERAWMQAAGCNVKATWADQYGIDVALVAGQQSVNRTALGAMLTKGTPNSSQEVGGNGSVTARVNYGADGFVTGVSYNGKTSSVVVFEKTNWYSSLTGDYARY